MITDPRSSLTKTKSSRKESSFLAVMRLIKSVGASNLHSPVIARKFLPLCYRNTRLGCLLTNAINKRTICKKIDFNLLRLFYSLVWVTDFLSFKRLTLKKGFMEHLWCYNFHSRVFFGYVVYQCATGHKINMIP